MDKKEWRDIEKTIEELKEDVWDIKEVIHSIMCRVRNDYIFLKYHIGKQALEIIYNLEHIEEWLKNEEKREEKRKEKYLKCNYETVKKSEITKIILYEYHCEWWFGIQLYPSKKYKALGPFPSKRKALRKLAKKFPNFKRNFVNTEGEWVRIREADNG